MRPAEYAVCEVDAESDGLTYILDLCATRGEAFARLKAYTQAPPGDIIHIDGCVAVYQLVCCRPGRGAS